MLSPKIQGKNDSSGVANFKDMLGGDDANMCYVGQLNMANQNQLELNGVENAIKSHRLGTQVTELAHMDTSLYHQNETNISPSSFQNTQHTREANPFKRTEEDGRQYENTEMQEMGHGQNLMIQDQNTLIQSQA